MSVWMGRPGNRKIDNWECGGDATINEYFIRLTPDRQSKNGFCSSKTTFTNGEWVTTIKFRISGQVGVLVWINWQGASLFGDGFSVFFTQERVHKNVVSCCFVH